MDMRWSLDELYTSFESEEFRRDLAQSEVRIAEINQWIENNLKTKDNAVEKMEEYIKMVNDFTNSFGRVMSFASLSLAVDAKNEQASKVQGKVQQLGAETTSFKVKFEKWVGTLENLSELIASSELLGEHRFILEEMLKKGEHLLSEEEEIIIAKMSTTGAQAWSNLQRSLTSNLLVDINVGGEERQVALSIVRSMAYDQNPAVRKAGYLAELAAYPKIEEPVAAALNAIKGQTITVAKLKGYASPLHKTLEDARLTTQTLDAMLEAMKESLPMFHKYFRRKAKLLGHEGGLPFYDIFAPLGSVEMKFSYDEAREYIVKNFQEYNPKLAEFSDYAFANRWIDAESRAGKQGGAFCHGLKMIGEARILANFNGSFSSIATLAHELGHAYHGYCLLNETPMNSHYPMPLAETASTLNETIIFNAAINAAGPAEAFAILEKEICNAAQTIVDIYSRFLFESEVFKRRADHTLSVKELNEIMLEAQKSAYGEGIDNDYLHQYMWIPKGHYYYANLNFYNYPYAFGLLFAKGIYAEYLKHGSAFLPEIDRLLAATGKLMIADVAKMVGIDINSIDFWRQSLKVIEEDVDKFLELSESM